MLRKDKGQHGNDFAPPGASADPVVTKFFENERQRHKVSPRSLERVTHLLPGRISVLLNPFEHSMRNKYFEQLIESLHREELGSKRIVLVDPDNGIAGRNCKGEHVKASELKLLWDHLHPGDSLIIYQHSNRSATWRRDKQQLVETAIGTDCFDVRVHSSVCFFRFDKLATGNWQLATEDK
jgi:hypothetical protein